MVKTEVDFTYRSKATLTAMKNRGLLLTSVSQDGKPNAMAIGWGLLGTIWRKPIFLTLVRPARFTHKLIEETGEFVVNVPTAKMADIVNYCGTVSGSAHDKFREKKIRIVPGTKVKVPSIADCPVHYECKVIYKLKIDPSTLFGDIKELYKDGEYHTLYFGEILATYAEKT
jgi:flavin reductase (DIM6/NTAB) family NADH-FMN oxidoreductase RutF